MTTLDRAQTQAEYHRLLVRLRAKKRGKPRGPVPKRPRGQYVPPRRRS